MPRLTTRLKRKMGLTTSRKHRFWKGQTRGRKRMKSFAKEEQAKAWASAQQLDEHYELRQLPSGKWQWRPKNKYLSSSS